QHSGRGGCPACALRASRYLLLLFLRLLFFVLADALVVACAIFRRLLRAACGVRFGLAAVGGALRIVCGATARSLGLGGAGGGFALGADALGLGRGRDTGVCGRGGYGGCGRGRERGGRGGRQRALGLGAGFGCHALALCEREATGFGFEFAGARGRLQALFLGLVDAAVDEKLVVAAGCGGLVGGRGFGA